MKLKILIVDDSPSDRFTFRKWVEEWGYEPIEAPDASTGEKIAVNEDIVAAILDYRLPDFDGVELFRRINKVKPGLPMILITGAHRPELTIQAMSEGLYHYMPKPADMDELRIHLDRAINIKNMKNEYMRIKASKGEDWFIGSSSQMLDVYRLIGMFANQNSPVLIYGETGTGKELVARSLHNYSNRCDEKFITLHISSLSQNLVESELFGHEKGSFTGADRRHKGRFEAAGKGTLFLDELADIPSDTQAKLLRVLEYGDYTSVGGEEPLQNNARLVVATNVMPETLVQDGRMREDLHYRLDVCRISLPPLREHAEDIAEFVNYFIDRENINQGRDIIGVSNQVLSEWKKHDWPGNVRQLQNTIRRAVSTTRDRIITESFLHDEPEMPAYQPLQGRTDDSLRQSVTQPRNLKEEISGIEYDAIVNALEVSHGNLAKAAQMIGLSRREIEWRMKKYKINASDYTI
jgi:DNA-binding NtrC family response regulator